MLRIVVITLLVATCALAPATAGPKPPTLDQFSWLLGTWQRQQKSGPLFEYWQRDDSTTFSGRGYTVTGTDTAVTERMRLLATDTALFFVADVEHNDSAIYFSLISFDSTGAVFENAQHDFPTRVIYKQLPPDSMHARIEGMVKDKPRGIDFLFSKVK